MYNNKFRAGRGQSHRFSPRGGNSFGGGNGGGRGRSFGGRNGGGGGRRMKTFDPSEIVNMPPRIEEFKEYEVTHQFSDFVISDSIKRNIAAKGYVTPTPIQDQAIPPILEGRDIVGMANTGTGKTAAFLIPLIEKVLKDRNQRVLIVTPTRELAAQIRDEFYTFANGLNIYVALVIGGANMGRQREQLKRHPSFVIGTPGRIEDHLRSRTLNLSFFQNVVLDEADRMIDVGFIQNMRNIISQLSHERQSLLFSATVDAKVASIIPTFVRNPVTISVKSGDITQNIKQEVVRIVLPNTKNEELRKLLVKQEFEKVLIFGKSKYGVQKLSDTLVKEGFRAGAIHGNKNQSQRSRILDAFKKSEIKILLATDVASRGLDIPNVTHVINYDLPESYENYIHRIGRTGRADKKGVALTFIG